MSIECGSEKYYRCLANHDESDEDVYERIVPFLIDFKELSNIKRGK
jgi:hypothetical protein